MKAYLLSLNPEANIADQWDFGFLSDFLNGVMWTVPNSEEFEIFECDILPKDDVAVVVIPARHHKGLEEEINKELQKIKRVVFFCMGDEEADFDIKKIEHPDIHIWIQNPHPDKHQDYHKLGTGYPPQIRDNLPPKFEKTKELFFSGQITHKRRKDMYEKLDTITSRKWDLNGTRGFTQGFNHKEYYERMGQAKVAPAPSGAVIPDSFRLFEALELMCIPIADQVSPSGDIQNYWDWFFDGTAPFCLIKDYKDLIPYVLESVDEFDKRIQKQTAWYIDYKRNFAWEVWGQLNGV